MTPADPALDPTGSFLHWVILWTSIAAFVTIVFSLGHQVLRATLKIVEADLDFMRLSWQPVGRNP
jgi:hypothetical protein